MLQIITMSLLFIAYTVYLLNFPSKERSFSRIPIAKWACHILLFFILSSIFQFIIIHGLSIKNQKINAKLAINVLIIYPIIETAMIGGIHAIMTKIIKNETIFSFSFIIFSAVFWPTIHESTDNTRALWQVFGFGYMSFMFMMAEQKHGNLPAFLFASLLHASANLGMLLTLRYAVPT